MSDFEFMTGLCKAVLAPLAYRPFDPITEAEKQEILDYERDMEEIMAEEDWPPYDIALEL